MGSAFSWDTLTTAPTPEDTLNPFSVPFLIVFAIGFIASTYLYYRPWQPPLGRYFRRKAIHKATTISMWVFGFGLFLFLIRLLQINPFTLGVPLWMVLTSIVAVVMLAVFAAKFWQVRSQPAPTGSGSRLDSGSRLPYAPAGGRRPVRRRPR
jgi:hypothetical protein